MKKLLTILLSMALVLSLAAPAFAVPAPDAAPVDGVYTVDGEAVPVYKAGDAIPISAFLPEASNDAVLSIIGGADGPTSIITTGPLGGFNWDGLDLEGLDPGSTDWAELEKQFEQMYQQQRDEIKKALGGVPGQVGVMVNGVYVKFPDAAPEVAGGRTMVPVRALVEAMGGEVDYEFADQKDSVRLFIDKYTINFTIGGTTAVRHTRGTDTGEADKTIEMDCAPYIKGGSAYVPVRFIAEALGCDVGWDNAYQTAVLLDREALADKIDEKFTILNKVQANKSVGMEEGKNYQADVKGNVSVTLFDTLNGNKTYKADLTAKQLFNTEAASAQMSLKLSDNALEELNKLLAGQFGSGYEEAAAMMLTVAEDMEVILTREGLGWLRAAALDELAGKENVWIALDLGADWGQLAFTQAEDATIGWVLAQAIQGDSVTEWGSAMETVDLLDSLYGDDKFTTDRGVSALTIGVDDLFDLYKDKGLSEADMAEAKAAFKEYEITMKVDAKGGAEVTIIMETAPQAGVPGMKITMDVKQADGNVTMDMNFHIANMGEMKVELTQTQKAVRGRPMTEPPEGSTVVDSVEPFAF